MLYFSTIFSSSLNRYLENEPMSFGTGMYCLELILKVYNKPNIL